MTQKKDNSMVRL